MTVYGNDYTVIGISWFRGMPSHTLQFGESIVYYIYPLKSK